MDHKPPPYIHTYPTNHLRMGMLKPSGKHTKKTMEYHNILWVNQLFLWPFSIAMLVYQRVSWNMVYCCWFHGKNKISNKFDCQGMEGSSRAAQGRAPSGVGFYQCVMGGIWWYIWVNYNDLTATSLESWLVRGNIPKIALFQVSEFL